MNANRHFIPGLELLHKSLGLTAPLDPTVRPFWGRPFRVIGGERFAEALAGQISDLAVQRSAARRLIGVSTRSATAPICSQIRAIARHCTGCT